MTESAKSRRPQRRPQPAGSKEAVPGGRGDSGLLGRQVFEVDHPFMFLVWDYYSGMILLMGTVLHPEQILT